MVAAEIEYDKEKNHSEQTTESSSGLASGKDEN